MANPNRSTPNPHKGRVVGKNRPPIKVTVTTKWTPESARRHVRFVEGLAAEEEAERVNEQASVGCEGNKKF